MNIVFAVWILKEITDFRLYIFIMRFNMISLMRDEISIIIFAPAHKFFISAEN